MLIQSMVEIASGLIILNVPKDNHIEKIKKISYHVGARRAIAHAILLASYELERMFFSSSEVSRLVQQLQPPQPEWHYAVSLP